MSYPLVSVVVPAFNAASTIVATLRSASAQTWRTLEILVVDDGSTDATAEIVAGLIKQDSRIKLLRQANGGVARARNLGIEHSVGMFIAPLDADDLWAPTKIERQLEAFDAAGPDVALAYNWFRRIDMNDRVLPPSPHPHVDGHVFHRHLHWNFISNGSTPLVRTEIARAVRYEPALRDAGLQGCEDYYFQLQVALDHPFVCVPAFLTGYRQVPGAMSTGSARMIQSHLLMYRMIMPRANQAARSIIRSRIAHLQVQMARHLVRRGKLGRSLYTAASAIATYPSAAIEAMVEECRRIMAETGPGSAGPVKQFSQWGVDEPDGSWATRRSKALLNKLSVLDQEASAR